MKQRGNEQKENEQSENEQRGHRQSGHRHMRVRVYLAEIFIACLCMGMFFGHLADFFRGFLAGFNDVTFQYAQEHYSELSKILSFVAVLLLAITGVMIYRKLRRRIASPIERLADGMHEVSRGNLSLRIPVESGFELYQMEESFNSMVEELNRAEQVKKEQARRNQLLYAGIAHDLKTPMTMIMGYARLLEMGNGISESDKHKYLGTIIEQTARANELLDSMLSYSRLDSDACGMRLERGDIAECLRAGAADVYSMFEKADMDIELRIPEEGLECAFDKLEMGRVFRNLLSNVVKHNPPRTSCIVLLQDGSDSMGNPSVEIVIADNGPKVAPDFEKYLFDMFAVGDDSRNTGGGSGLGLSISKKIVERHSGTIRYAAVWKDAYKAFVISIPRPV